MIKNSYIKTKQYYKADKKVEKSVPKIAVSVHNNQDGTDGTNVASEYFYRYTISTYKETYYTQREREREDNGLSITPVPKVL